MSTHRTSPESGFVNPSSLPRGPNGRALCRQCSLEVPKGRRTFCSDQCVDNWKVRTDPQHVRRLVFKRDKGICADCKVDTEALRKQRRTLAHPELKEFLDLHRGQLAWEADHIVPVIEGGGECGLENYRTLCQRCHRNRTAELRRRMAGRAREQRAAEKDAGRGLLADGGVIVL